MKSLKTLIASLAFGLVVLTTLVIGLFSKKHDSLIVLGEESSNLEAYRSLSEQFLELTDVPVDFEGATFERAYEKADIDFSTGAGYYDVVLQYNFSLAEYVENQYVVAIGGPNSPSVLNNSNINEHVFENLLSEICFYYDHSLENPSAKTIGQFGLPFAGNTMMLAYNRDLFENSILREKYFSSTGRELQPPKTWNDFFTIAEFFGSEENLYGICLQGAPGGWLYYELANFLVSMGTGTSDKKYGWEENTRLTIDTPENVDVLNRYKTLIDFNKGNYYTVDALKQRDLFLEGDVAMAIMWSDYLFPLEKDRQQRFKFSTIPGEVSGLAGGAFYINQDSRNTDMAAQFVIYALAPEKQKELILKGLCSPIRSAYTEEVMQEISYARPLRDSLERGIFMFEAGTDADAISSKLTAYVQRFIRGEITAEQALKQAQTDVLSFRTKK